MGGMSLGRWIAAGLIWAAGATTGAAQSSLGPDVEGAADPVQLGERFPDARITQQKRVAYDALAMWLSEAARDKPADLTLEGEILSTVYAIPKERSALEVFRAYERALKEAKAERLYTCEGRACGGGGGTLDGGFRKRMSKLFIDADSRRYGVFKIAPGAGPASYVQLYVAKAAGVVGPSKDQISVLVDVLTTDAVEADLEAVTAESIAEEIALRGAAALYGVNFALDSAEITANSRPVLDEIGRYLVERPAQTFLIVGHTDDQGALDYNLDLSRRRAAAVAADLVARYGVAAGRLEAHGVGYLAPLAPNSDEAGRARNRRVEIVAR